MSNVEQFTQLSPSEIAEVQRMAQSKLVEYRKTQDIIGNQVFSILSLSARVFYYPFGENELWGITYLRGMDNNTPPDKPFVTINTSIPLDAQVFAAAHELYHIWFSDRPEAIPTSILGDTDEQGNPLDACELKANRFAAEFLVDKYLLQHEMQLFSIQPKKLSIKDILTLASLFTVPYRTMVKRLQEIDAISFDDRERYLTKSESSILQLRKRYSIPVADADNRIAIDNLVELSVVAYEQKKITYEKLQYLLSISNLEPKAIGIAEPHQYTPPSDEIIDSIMEE